MYAENVKRVYLLSVLCVVVFLSGCTEIIRPPTAKKPANEPSGVQTTQSKSWWNSSGGSSETKVAFVKTDHLGNTYALGSFRYSARFGTFSLQARRNWDLYVAKIGKTGKFLWVKQLSVDTVDGLWTKSKMLFASGLAIDGKGQATIALNAGSARTQLETRVSAVRILFGSKEIALGGYQALLLKLDTKGLLLKQKVLKSMGRISGIENHKSGSLLLRGISSRTGSFGKTKLPDIGRRTLVIVGKLDSEWREDWAFPISMEYSVKFQESLHFRLDQDEKVWIVGNNTFTLVGLTEKQRQGFQKGFFSLKLNEKGVFHSLAFGKKLSMRGFQMDERGHAHVQGVLNAGASFQGRVLHFTSALGLFHFELNRENKLVQNDTIVGGRWAASVRYMAHLQNGDVGFWGSSVIAVHHKDQIRIPTSHSSPNFEGSWNTMTGGIQLQKSKIEASIVGVHSGKHDQLWLYGVCLDTPLSKQEQSKAHAAKNMFVLTIKEPSTASWATSSQGFSTLIPLQVEALSDGGRLVLMKRKEDLTNPHKKTNSTDAPYSMTRFSKEGKLVWQKPFPVGSFMLDKKENILSIGDAESIIDLAFLPKAPAVVPAGLFFAKWDLNGAIQKAHSLHSVGATVKKAMLTKDGKIVFAGELRHHSAKIGSHTLPKTWKSRAAYALYIAVCDTNGKLLRVSLGISRFPTTVNDFSVSGDSAIGISTFFYGEELQFGKRVIKNTLGKGRSLFVAMNMNGEVLFTKDMPEKPCGKLSVKGAGDGHFYMVEKCSNAKAIGEYINKPEQSLLHTESAFVITKMDTKGKTSWRQHFVGQGSLFFRDLSVEADGKLVIAGDFEGYMKFKNGAKLSAKGGRDLFLVRLDKDGSILKTRAIGGKKDEELNEINISHNGMLSIAGSTKGTFSLSSMSISNPGGKRMFVVNTGLKSLWEVK